MSHNNTLYPIEVFFFFQGDSRVSNTQSGQELKEELQSNKEELRQAKDVIEDLMANRKSLPKEVDSLKSLLNGLDDNFFNA